jgi:hypothetical protein
MGNPTTRGLASALDDEHKWKPMTTESNGAFKPGLSQTSITHGFSVETQLPDEDSINLEPSYENGGFLSRPHGWAR